MKQTFCYLFVAVNILFLSSCIRPDGGSDGLIVAKSAFGSQEKKRRERDKEALRGDCKDYGECEDVCEDVYNEEGDRENEGKVERCSDLSYKTAITFEDILDIMEEPYYADLLNIEARDFEKFLEVSVAPWVEKIKRLNNSEAENLLKWIASESKVAGAIRKAYDKQYEDFDLYEGLEKLFEEIAPDLTDYSTATGEDRAVKRCAEFCSAVGSKTLAQNQSFWEIADYSGNVTGLTISCSLLRLKCRYEGASVVSSVDLDDCPIVVSTDTPPPPSTCLIE